MRLKSIIASAFTALMVACPVLAFSESADFDDSVRSLRWIRAWLSSVWRAGML